MLKVIDYHLSNDSSCTIVTKEWDPNFKPKFFLAAQQQDAGCPVFGLSENDDSGVSRVVMRANSQALKDMHYRMHKSFLKKCKKFSTRTDLLETGIYFCKHWILNLLSKIKADTDEQVDPIELGEFLNFLIKN